MRVLLIIGFIFFLNSANCLSQIIQDEESVYHSAENVPFFNYKGGRTLEENLTNFYEDSLNYTPQYNCKGKVFIEFIVERDGRLSNIRIVKGLNNCNEYNNEAERVIRSMPRWIPAKHLGKNVRFKMILPVEFE